MAKTPHIIVIGAGVAGLVSALELAAKGFRVSVVERAGQPGGKMREVDIDGIRLDAGPTVFTMRWVFEELFSDLNQNFTDHINLTPLRVLARHAWSENERLDLFADIEQSVDAIGDFAGAAEAQAYRRFCENARQIYTTLEDPFIRSPQPSPLTLVRAAGLGGLGGLWKIRAFDKLWNALGEYFRDQRLRQLFGRYATYCGSSPFQATATLMLVAHVEQAGVWLIDGGMHQLAKTLAQLAQDYGAVFHYHSEVDQVLLKNHRVTGVELDNGERLDADAVVVNADAAAIASGKLGSAITAAVPSQPRSSRSLSALTWNMLAKTKDFPLLRHNVFFSANYRAEFEDIFQHSCLPQMPTVYVCAQDRDDDNSNARDIGPERLLCLVNAPALGDSHSINDEQLKQCEQRTFDLLEHCGLTIQRQAEHTLRTTPQQFEQLFPATGGALYGQSSHGWKASFNRPTAKTRIPGLYLAGGSTHPGPGVPMAALSGRLAAAAVAASLSQSIN